MPSDARQAGNVRRWRASQFKARCAPHHKEGEYRHSVRQGRVARAERISPLPYFATFLAECRTAAQVLTRAAGNRNHAIAYRPSDRIQRLTPCVAARSARDPRAAPLQSGALCIGMCHVGPLTRWRHTHAAYRFDIRNATVQGVSRNVAPAPVRRGQEQAGVFPRGARPPESAPTRHPTVDS